MEREEGYYWVKYEEDWCVASCSISSMPLTGKINIFTLSGIEQSFLVSEFDEIGHKIEPPVPKHECKWMLVEDREGKMFRICECGAMLIPECALTEEDSKKLLDNIRTSGAIFKVVDDKN